MSCLVMRWELQCKVKTSRLWQKLSWFHTSCAADSPALGKMCLLLHLWWNKSSATHSPQICYRNSDFQYAPSWICFHCSLLPHLYQVSGCVQVLRSVFHILVELQDPGSELQPTFPIAFQCNCIGLCEKSGKSFD